MTTPARRHHHRRKPFTDEINQLMWSLTRAKDEVLVYIDQGEVKHLLMSQPEAEHILETQADHVAGVFDFEAKRDEIREALVELAASIQPTQQAAA